MAAEKTDDYYDTACPLCQEEGYDTAEDNLRVYESGINYCIVRHGKVEKVAQRASTGLTKALRKADKNMTGLIDGEYTDIKSRGINKKTAEFYGYMVNKEKGVHVANYYDDAGTLKMQQLRTADKQFPILGDKSFNETLWGMHKFDPNENVFITITEGGIDCLTVAQVFDCKYPIVSLPNGAPSAFKVLQKNMHLLSKFKYVVLGFDSDETGYKATEECIKLFEPGKVKIARWLDKDANAMLLNGREAEIRKCVYNAVSYMPAPVLSGDALMERLSGYKYVTKPWPWRQANELFNPIKKPSVISIVAKPKRGKTEFMAAITAHELSQGGNVAIISVEQSPEETFLKQVGSQIGKDLLSLTENRELTEEEKAWCEPFKDRIVIYDHVNFGQTIDSIVKYIPYMVRALNCEYVVLDNLSASASASGGDERKGLDKAMADLKSLTVKYNFTLFNVMHLKRDNNMLSDEDNDIPNVEQIRGTQGVESYSDVVIGLHRNPGSENKIIQNTLSAHVLADRASGNKTGNSFKLRYNPKTKMLQEG